MSSEQVQSERASREGKVATESRGEAKGGREGAAAGELNTKH